MITKSRKGKIKCINSINTLVIKAKLIPKIKLFDLLLDSCANAPSTKKAIK